MRIPWAKEEAALLVDAYYRTERGELSTHAAVIEVSQLLRCIAINKGVQIDDKYRNANGIGMQMQFVKQTAMQTKSGLKNGSKLLRHMVDLRANDRMAFDVILGNARRNLTTEPEFNQELFLTSHPVLPGPVADQDTEEDAQIVQARYRESFSTWIDTHVPENEQVRIGHAFSALGMFCRKAGIIQMPLSTINDTNEVARIKQIIFSNRGLNIQSRKLVSDFKRVIVLYEEYLKDDPSSEDAAEHDAPDVVLLDKRTPNGSDGHAEIGPYSFIDFSVKGNYAFVAPVYATYLSERLDTIRSWKQAYVWLVNHLLRDYPGEMQQYIDKPIVGTGISDIRKISDKPVMRNAGELEPGLVVETGFSASDLMNRAGILMRACGADLSSVTLAYVMRSRHDPDKPKAPIPQHVSPLLELIRIIVSESFPNGIRYASIIDQNKLNRAYAAKLGEDIPSDLDLPALLKGAGILYGDKVYALTDDQKARIRDAVQRLFAEGHHVIYYGELLIHQAVLLEECHLYDAPLIRVVLKDLLPEAICNESCILAYEGITSIEVITQAFGEDIKLNYTQIKERCPYIEMGAIKWALSTSDRFVWTQHETFAQVDLIQLASNEVDQVHYNILPKMQEKGYVSLNRLPLQESCDLNPDVSFMAVRDAMYIRHMSNTCSKNGLIATPKGKTVSSYDLMAAYCRSVGSATMDELDDFERELTGNQAALILHAACYHMVRIDHDHFVSDESISFDIDAVDLAIGLFVNHRIAPITAITSFTSFPDVDGYEWNLYLVESFLRRFSQRFSIDGGPARSSYVGGICSKKMRFDSYEDRLAAAIVQDAIALNVEAIGGYLTEKKFILRRSAAVKTVCDKALKIKELRGMTGV